MSRSKALADAIRDSNTLLVRMLPGFDDASRTRQASGLPNHAAWILGHCALTMHRCAEKLDGGPLPAADFVTGDGHAGDAERFDTESICRDSVPEDAPDDYPTLARSQQVFDAACHRLADALAGCSDEQLDDTAPWSGADVTFSHLAARMVFHNGCHSGQLLDLRRALGLRQVLPRDAADQAQRPR